MEFFNLIAKRQSIRTFKNELIPEDDIKEILQAAIKAPSAGNLQAYEIFVIKDNDKKLLLSKAANDQACVKEASHCFVFCANPDRSKVKYNIRGEKLYCLEDSSIACTYSQLAAADLGYGSVWVGGFDVDKVREVLGIDESLIPVSILPIGIPNEKPQFKPRRDFDDIIHNL